MPRAPDDDPVTQKLRLPLRLTQAGMLAERLLRCFWPVISIVMAVLAALMLGLHELAPIEVVWILGVIAVFAGLGLGLRGALRFRWPGRADALARLDETLPGRPLRALHDQQAIGAGDAASAAVWRAHQARMAARAAAAKPVRPDLRLARRDPFALRYVALLALLVGLVFGSIWQVGSVTRMTPGGAAPLAGGPTWEGWVEPPRYTGLPTLYLNDIAEAELTVPENSRVTLRFYGEVGALTLAETVSGRTGELPSAADPQQDFTVTRSGHLRIDGPGGHSWDVTVVRDAVPEISVTGAAEVGAAGEMTLPFLARDDYGIIGGQAVIALDLDAVDRRYGLATDPEPREPVTVELPMPITGSRTDFSEKLIEDFSKHPWANLPVTITLAATDAAGQVGQALPYVTALPARRFFDPLAAAVAEQRRDLLWSRDNAVRVAQVLRAISHRPDEVFRSETAYLRLRVTLRRLENFTAHGITAAERDEIAEALWTLALLLEEGDLSDALERLRRAQDRLSEAMKNGASDQEIAELMQELRDATDNYMRQLSRQARENGEEMDPSALPENTLQMSQNDLQRMMDRIQELMEQGRMAEAEQALRELQQMMENMRVTQGQGQGGQSEGQRAMEGLSDTLRNQQGLSDQAFRDLQDRFSPDGQQGQRQPGQQGQDGREGEMGQGEMGQGEMGQGGSGGQAQGQGQDGQQPGQDGRPGTRQGMSPGDGPGSLADRQQALRQELQRQQGNLPGAGTPEGDAAREALGRAGRAMDGAEEALRQDDLAEAIDKQSEAIEALREGMRALGEALAQEEGRRSPQGQGMAEGDASGRSRDPLGREAGSNGALGSDEGMLQGEDVYRRARDLLDEIRRRSGEGERPALELEYLRRLLERF
ncbi:TIGR02302 family protein [Pseudodonghicola flavimaris]|uniref:TIGR02302 family protein n=1 Tax=Pseudodonghicola flavimaris TaxID=3050036 RepID=A0ABT7EX95_9RHOB|nr:TIGR02302 family protein [Pseudodonghicola flavimaris]MDK3016953.1 TIGR02302 family protein [Pseudodonghicola flavimaris]